MEEQNKLEKMVSDIKEYAETRFDIIVLNTQDKATHVISSIATSVIMGVLGFFILIFLSIGGAWSLGEYFNSPSIGFFSVAGFYLLVTILLYVNREKWIKMPIINSILKKITFHEND
ncbi:MAG: hypothetical protein K0Q95_2758 [Bacteroidota bacterium]|jgi:hypothetical protein|nr:hypothetical protein [Bacteroidota bacterium]